jgi:hypothetical protein
LAIRVEVWFERKVREVGEESPPGTVPAGFFFHGGQNAVFVPRKSLRNF